MKSGGTTHWARCSSQDDLAKLSASSSPLPPSATEGWSNGAPPAVDEVLDSLFTRNHTYSPEGRRASTRMDFVRGSPPPARPTGHVRSSRSVGHAIDNLASFEPLGRRASVEPTGLSVPGIPKSFDACAEEITRLRAQLEAERAATQQERIRRVACEAELALLHRERAAREGGGAQGLCVAAATGDVATLRSLAESSDVNKGDYDKRTVRRSAAQTLDWGSDSSARHV